jgi:hypothetical protein
VAALGPGMGPKDGKEKRKKKNLFKVHIIRRGTHEKLTLAVDKGATMTNDEARSSCFQIPCTSVT